MDRTAVPGSVVQRRRRDAIRWRESQGADHDTVALSDPAIGDQAAEERREVDEPGVEAENLRRERLR